LRAAADILSVVGDSRSITYAALCDRLEQIYGDSSKYLTLPALAMLFLLGKIEYDRTFDSMRLVV